MKKKILAMVLVILLFIELLPMTAFAEKENAEPYLHDCPGKAFADMPEETNWAHEGIDFCVANGLMNGISDTLFRPEGSLTRGQLVTILYRIVDAPEVSFRDIFSDIEEEKYYANAVIWAANYDIVNGYPDGTFCPQAKITREQIAAILYRITGEPDVTGSLDFPDAKTVSKYAIDAMLWATQEGLINGIKSGKETNLAPKANATRAQIASIMMRFLGKHKKEDLKGFGPYDGPEKIALAFTANRWPVVDGATAFLPFYQEMAARMLGVSTEEAADYILCSTTDYAYPYLWQKKVDLVFCLRPSEAQVQEAAQNGVVFEEVPFANEGFVFFVNKSNPVDSITVQQLHDIYAGKITNWKELGGNDEEIIAYQRTEGSGSQTGLYLHIIGPDEVVDPPIQRRAGTMNEIIDRVASYQNASGALGYSYRYFVTNMHYDDQIKMLQVDGIYPDYDSIADGSYPLISDVCAVYREDEPANSAARKIARWCCSSQGAVLAKELGYVPTAEAIGTLYKPNEYKHDDREIDYAEGNPCPECTVMSTYYQNNLDFKWCMDGNGSVPQISGLKNSTIQEEINQRIYDTYTELLEADYPHYPGIRTRIAMFDSHTSPQVIVRVENSFNNILSLSFAKEQQHWNKNGNEEGQYSADIRTLNFDLTTGKEIYIGDLFADNIDGIAYINEKILEQSDKPEAFDEPGENYYEISYDQRPTQIHFRKAFSGINPNQQYFIDAYGRLHIILDETNPEIANLLAPTNFAIDMRGINAYECRFMTETSIFEDETRRPRLFQRIPYENYVDDEFLTLPQSSEERNISYYATIIHYDDKTANTIKRLLQDEDFFGKIKAATEGVYDEYLQKYGPYIEATVHIEPSAIFYGDYTNIFFYIEYWMYSYSDEELQNLSNMAGLYTEKTLQCCLKADSDDPISLKDLFIPNFDWKTRIEEIMVRKLKEDVGDTYSEDIYLALTREIMDDLKGFFVDGNRIYLYCNDVVSTIRKHLSSGIEDVWSIQYDITYLTYEDLGAEHLTIFN